ncbi:MAG TPA: PaaI family thioesterase [Melioribacteraceae bacterium]|nr:PaaI family thioesterase [Melioribacteraceae bacterium]
MEKLKNIYLGNEDYYCFGCSPNNKYGLNMEFFKNGDEIISYWQPEQRFAGYKNILHGGIIATLSDEIASWTVSSILNKMAVTGKLEVKFKKPIYVDRGKIKISAKIIKQAYKTATIEVKLIDGDNNLCADSLVIYYILGDKKVGDLNI